MRSKRLSLGLAVVLAMFVVATLTTTTRAAAQTITLLYGFTASYNISEGPYAGVIEDSSGNLYGTTSGGGNRRQRNGIPAGPAIGFGRRLDGERPL